MLRKIVLRLLALLGLAASAILLADYLRPAPLFCDAGGGCDLVRQSAWSHLLGIPTPAFGVVFFAVALGLALAGRGRRLLVAWSGIGLGAGLAFFGLQAFAIHAFCKYCAVADGSAILLFIVTLIGREDDVGDSPPILARLGFGGVGVIAVALPFVISAIAAKPVVVVARVGPVPEVIVREQRPGVATIVEFVDFECPFCRALHQRLSSIMEEYGDRVRLVRKEHPLVSMHPHAMAAARAECCAEQADKGDEMADALYSAPPDDLTPEGCEKIAAQVGINLDAYRRCLASGCPRRTSSAPTRATRRSAHVGEEAHRRWIGDKFFRGVQPLISVVRRRDREGARVVTLACVRARPRKCRHLRQPRLDLVDGDGPAGEPRHRGHDPRVEAAGVDPREVIEIGGDVERQAVKRDPLPAERCRSIRPWIRRPTRRSCPAGARQAMPEIGEQSAGHLLFQVTQEFVQIALVGSQEDDRVNHELPGAMIGHVAAALDLDDGNLAGGEHVGDRLGAPADGDDVRMLDEDEGVVDLVLLPRADRGADAARS